MTTESNNSWLAVDVGNSRIKVGLFDTPDAARATPEKDESKPECEDIAGLPRCVDFRSVPLKTSVPWDEFLKGYAAGAQPNGVIVGSNQRGVDEVASDWPDWLQKPVVIRSSEFFPLDIQVDEPRRVGLDRLLNAVAADAVRGSGNEAIIVDCGTATTVDLISSAGSFCGGAILPGFTLCARALNQYTEVLPLISMNELFDLPPSEDCHPALGSNTTAAIMSGVFWGQIGAVRELIARLSQRRSAADHDTSAPKVLLTGGGARLLVPYFADAVHCPYLPLQGLVLAVSRQHL
ncbi:MAG: type III pantothenate kinase [Rhodopirellula sp.]|nr:type III pantothenate kinase [Rhodopirellula sp.]